MTIQETKDYRDKNEISLQLFAFLVRSSDSCHIIRCKMLMLSSQLIFVTLFFFASLTIQAKEVELTRMISDIEKQQSTPGRKQNAIAMGKERAVLCNQCHGVDGNSRKKGVPNLAEQNPVYLLDQIEKFADGRRKNYVMNALSKNFTRDDKENLAIFYASMKVNVTKTNTRLAKKGQPIYKALCGSCHGEKGAGQANYARLAGQQIHYIETTLRQFRDNSKNKSKVIKRRSVIMEPIANGLSDDDIKSLAAYLAQLK